MKDRPAGRADIQDDYEVEATDDRVTQHLRASYSHFIPDALAQPQDEPEETEPTATPKQQH